MNMVRNVGYTNIAQQFLTYRAKRSRPVPDTKGEKKLARAILLQWAKDLDGLIKVFEKVENELVAKGLVYDLKHLWNELDSEIMEFWCQVAGMDPYHLRRTFVIKVNNLIESRPDLKPFLKVFPLE